MITCLIRTQTIASGVSRKVIFKRQKGRCFYCDKALPGVGHPDCTRDHLFPRARGFCTNGNIVLACYECNQVKNARLPTIHEVLKAFKMIYRRSRFGFVCEVRNSKVVLRIT